MQAGQAEAKPNTLPHPRTRRLALTLQGAGYMIVTNASLLWMSEHPPGWVPQHLPTEPLLTNPASSPHKATLIKKARPQSNSNHES
jgi:hypothetical protein